MSKCRKKMATLHARLEGGAVCKFLVAPAVVISVVGVAFTAMSVGGCVLATVLVIVKAVIVAFGVAAKAVALVRAVVLPLEHGCNVISAPGNGGHIGDTHIQKADRPGRVALTGGGVIVDPFAHMDRRCKLPEHGYKAARDKAVHDLLGWRGETEHEAGQRLAMAHACKIIAGFFVVNSLRHLGPEC